jgi:tetratricopeptide (TPR) repeat protein
MWQDPCPLFRTEALAMSPPSAAPSGHDIFLSYASPDAAWVATLAEELTRRGARVFLDKRELRPADNWVLDLNAGLLHSRFLAVVCSRHALGRPWVEQEWTGFLATHGPTGRLVPLLLEAITLPPMLAPLQGIDATHRDAGRVADALLERIGRADLLPEGDARRLYIGQDLVFVLARDDGQVRVTDPLGRMRSVAAPWEDGTAFLAAHLEFRRLSREPVADDAGRAELTGHATALGQALFGLLFDERGLELLRQATVPGGPRPLVSVWSADDRLLALPWELLHAGGSFLVRDGKVELARSLPGPVDPSCLLRPPAGYFKLVVNVSAPAGSHLDYEAESYRITRALAEKCRLVPTELGTADDLVETAYREGPTGIHFSGHGGRGVLVFEDAEGREAVVRVAELAARLKKRLPGGRLPPFFYLASCHGNDPGVPEEGEANAESSAARLHREGVAQVVGYHGPIADELSTQAEEALYAALAEGQTTGYAVRQAREALARPQLLDDGRHRPRQEGAAAGVGASPAGPAAGPAHTHPFAWAQLVFYHRGPDHPLSLPVPAGELRRAEEGLRRTFQDAGTRRVLLTGFIGRRTDLHRVRRRLREGRRVHVFQGLGGLGKTTLALQVLPWLGSKEDIWVLWCQEAEQAPDRAEALVGQLLDYCRRRFGHAEWNAVEQQVDRAAGDDPALRFAYYLSTALEHVPRLVLYLDNLESLLFGPAGPAGDGGAEFAAWQSPALGRLWDVLRQLARDTGKLHVVASCRYQNDDLADDLVPVSPLPADALYRLMGWFEGLRRLSGAARARLVGLLAGHPRAVEYANDLVADQLTRRRRRKGEWRLPPAPTEADLAREWHELVEPALPRVQEKLRDNLLFDALWERVLDEPARRMLYRMTLLRRPWSWGLMAQLGEPEEDEVAAEGTAERLCRTSLVEQVEAGGAVEYTLHPATAEFIRERFGDDPALRQATHRCVGDYLEAEAKTSPYIETDIDAGHHLFHAGEYNRAYELLGPASEWLQDRGRVREGLHILESFLPESVRLAMRQELVGFLIGTVGHAYHRLGQVEKAIGYYEQHLQTARAIGNRQGESIALGSLGLAYARLAQVQKAIGYHEQALQIDREIGNRQYEMADLGNLGAAYLRLGQVEKAVGYYEQALEIARAIGDRQGEGNTLGSLGTAYLRLGQVEKAVGYYEQALQIARAIGDRQGEGNAVGNLGLAYAALGQVEKAVGYCEQALQIARAIGDRQGEGNALGSLGLAYARLDQVEKAVTYFEQALQIARAIGDRQGEGNTLGSLGTAYLRLGQVEKAAGYYEQALQIARAIGDRQSEGNALVNLGLAYAALGQVEKAIAYYEQALQIGQETKDAEILRVASAQLQRLRGGDI